VPGWSALPRLRIGHRPATSAPACRSSTFSTALVRLRIETTAKMAAAPAGVVASPPPAPPARAATLLLPVLLQSLALPALALAVAVAWLASVFTPRESPFMQHRRLYDPGKAANDTDMRRRRRRRLHGNIRICSGAPGITCSEIYYWRPAAGAAAAATLLLPVLLQRLALNGEFWRWRLAVVCLLRCSPPASRVSCTEAPHMILGRRQMI